MCELCVSARPNSRGAKNGSIIHTRVHPHNTRHDVDLNIVLDRLRSVKIVSTCNKSLNKNGK